MYSIHDYDKSWIRYISTGRNCELDPRCMIGVVCIHTLLICYPSWKSTLELTTALSTSWIGYTIPYGSCVPSTLLHHFLTQPQAFCLPSFTKKAARPSINSSILPSFMKNQQSKASLPLVLHEKSLPPILFAF